MVKVEKDFWDPYSEDEESGSAEATSAMQELSITHELV